MELRHWARAQAISERWRAGLHAAFGLVNEEVSRSEQTEEKLIEVVQRLHARGQTPTAADAVRYIRGLGSADAQRYLDGLVRAGELGAIRSERATRYRPAEHPETTA